MASKDTVKRPPTFRAVSPGWLPRGTPLSDYLAIPAMSSSGLERFRVSPAHYRHAIDNPIEPTPAMQLGTAVHTAVLEPDRFHAEYRALPERCQATTKAGKQCSKPAAVIRDGEGFCTTPGHDPAPGEPKTHTSLSLANWLKVMEMARAVADHPMANALLRAHAPLAEIERSGVFRDPETGVLCKFRPDRLLRLGDGFCIDLKTARDASPRGFARAIADRGYHRQASMYRRGLAALGEDIGVSVLVAVESAPPHAVGCYMLREDDLARAHEDVTGLLERHRRCVEDDHWPGYPAELQEVELPGWAFSYE